MGFLTCYCAKRIRELGTEAAEEVFQGSGRRLCKEWAGSYSVANGLMLGIAAVVTLVNVAIPYVVVALTKFEKLHSATAELVSATVKIFVLQFVNSVSSSSL